MQDQPCGVPGGVGAGGVGVWGVQSARVTRTFAKRCCISHTRPPLISLKLAAMCECSYYYPVCQFSWQLLSRWCGDDVSGLAMLLLHQPLGPLHRPPPRHPKTNYFLFVTETQSSEGHGIFCCLSYQPNLTLFPPVGHSLTGSCF